MFKKNSDKSELKEKLSKLQYKVTQKDGTEPAFKNEYWNNEEPGIYVDVVSGEPLFSSVHKYDSGTGWPSFYQPIKEENITTKEDRKLWVKRTEVRSKEADSHLGHVFPDGPEPTGQRYCMNSAAMRFIPVEKLESEGYGEFLSMFENNHSKKKENELEKATFGAGCFWGVEHIFQKVKGVIETKSGYSGGNSENPTYEEICTGTTGHAEVVELVYDKSLISYGELVDIFWRLHDPTQVDRQGVDVGTQYRSTIFYHNEDQKRVAEVSKQTIEREKRFPKPIATKIEPASKFYIAEDYHQNYINNTGKPSCHVLLDWEDIIKS